MAGVSAERVREDLTSLLHRGADVRDFVLGAGRVLARAVPFEGVCVLTMDPDTLVPTGEVVENGLPVTAYARMAEIEVRGEDYNAFRSLALSERRAATLDQATRSSCARSPPEASPRRSSPARSPRWKGPRSRCEAWNLRSICPWCSCGGASAPLPPLHALHRLRAPRDRAARLRDALAGVAQSVRAAES